MKKAIFILSAIVLSGLAFDGCKKGPDDPFISLHTRKGRLDGKWAISSGTDSKTTGSNTTTTTWTATTVTVGSASGTGTYTIEFVKDGTYKLNQSTTFGSFTSTHSETGTWNWLGGVGDKKNKEQIVLRQLTVTDNGSTETYTGDSAPSTVYELDELKNKELKITWTGTDNNGSSTTTDTGNMVFAKQ